MPRILTGDETEAVRAEIGAVARRLYAKGGMAAITMRDIARSLGRSPMGLYRYFEDREAIVAWLRTDAFTSFSEALEHAFASGSDAFARARAVGRAYLDFALKNPDAYRLMFDLSQPDDARHAELIAAADRASETVTRHVKDLAAAGIVHGDPLVVGQALWAAAHGVIVLHLAGRLPPGCDVTGFYLDTMRIAFRGARAVSTRAASKRAQER
ncbi:MAG: TetR family transcriptional regulator [Alphaproteobacteria bacterium]|nr:TetR family transcriptional regulator [Alphaproteobacteria bacterium]